MLILLTIYWYLRVWFVLESIYLLIYSGHIQVSQVPGRGEPSSAGEINYDYVFQLLRELGYNKWIGCEYNPQGINMLCLKFPEY